MSIETEIAALTTSTTALLSAVTIQQTTIEVAVSGFATTTTRVDALNLVENTADADKEVSGPQATAIGLKVSASDLASVNGQPLNTGLALVIARGAIEKPVLVYASRATLRTPSLPVPLAGDILNIPHLGEFQYEVSFNYVDDDETVFQVVDPSDGVTPIGQWVMSLEAHEFTEVNKMFENAVLWEWMEDEQLRFATY